METSEFEYRLLKDKCNSVVAELRKCRNQHEQISPTETADYSLFSGTVDDLHNNYIFTAPDYLSIIDYLACDH